MPEGEGQEPTTGSPVETTAPNVTAPETVADPFDSEEVQQFDRAYVKALREEAAGYRTKVKDSEKYKSVFEGYDEESQNVLLNTLNLLKTDTPKGVEALQQIVQALTPAEQEELETALDDQTGETKPVDVQAEVERILAERDVNSKQEAAIQGVIKEVEDAGFAAGTPDHIKVLWIAHNMTNNDLGEAVKVVKAERQSIIDEYIKSKTDANGRFITPTEGTSVSESTGSARTPKEARERLEARLDAIAGGGD